MIKTLGQRSKEEERRTYEEGLRSVGSNYLFCPSLCRNCNNFSEENSTYPYKCKTGNSDHIAYKSKKEGYKQYDDCIFYKEKTTSVKNENIISSVITSTPNNEPKKSEQKIEQKEEIDWQKFREEQEYNRTHCFVCGKEGNLIEFLGKYFHEKCLELFKNTEKGKNWIEKTENENIEHKIMDIVNKYGEHFWNMNLGSIKWKPYFHLFLEYKGIKPEEYDYTKDKKTIFLNADLDSFATFVDNKCKKIEEDKKTEELKREPQGNEKKEKSKTDKAKKSLQRKIKLPVFIIGLLPLLYAFGTFPTIDKWLPIISLVVIVFIFYKMLSGWINSAYDVIEEYKSKGNNPSKGYKFIVYFGVVLVSLVVYFGLLFLVMHILLKVW